MNVASSSRSFLFAARRLCFRCSKTSAPFRSYSTEPDTPAPGVILPPVPEKPYKIHPAELKQILPTIQDLGLNQGDHVTVAMSGGVDSSVALKILHGMPIHISVLFMRNWDRALSESEFRSDNDNSKSKFGLKDLSYSSGSTNGKGKSACEWERDWEDVKSVCKHIGVPEKEVKMVDFSKEYWSRVFEPCVDVWQNGGTPNPDVMCNSEIKFGTLLEHVASRTRKKGHGGARHYLATGHYARVLHQAAMGRHRLFRAKDMTKDQSYYLSGLTIEQIERTILPLAKITKGWTRRLAKHWQLPTADREESMGVCFIGERDDFGDFITQYTAPDSGPPGRIYSDEGRDLGPHRGLWHYTIGQRARLPGMEERWFVARKGTGESEKDMLVVPGADHPSMMAWRIDVPLFTWQNMAPPPKGIVAGNKYQIQVRHRMKPVQARIKLRDDGLGIICEPLEPLAAVAPGQVLAIYRNLEVLGSGVITKTRCMDDQDEDRPVRTRQALVKSSGKEL